ncbi:hypothetical protein Y032_0519g2842 [Ancylostoma ceylanicum]|uniref:Uncharacterized protein n=1 Tax=Ancylostoma ceylanicum TaxID=53326 RepID=A0A016WUR9_9BILA|nr:hypothetical protein Y032_0519g2842 [Ancylostoma ceylanicum]
MPIQSQRKNRKNQPSSASQQESTLACDPLNKNYVDNDPSKLSELEIVQVLIARNKDPEIDQLLQVLLSKKQDKIKQEVADYIDAEKRGRSLVIAGIDESNASLPLKLR